jgi:hypothetical protein
MVSDLFPSSYHSYCYHKRYLGSERSERKSGLVICARKTNGASWPGNQCAKVVALHLLDEALGFAAQRELLSCINDKSTKDEPAPCE